MTTAVDSAVLLDVFQEEPGWAARSADAALSTLGVEFDPMTAAAAADAGRLWRAFRDAGGGRRDRVVADFLVGAHALHQAQALLTRDRGFYRRYFKRLRIVEPG